MTTSPLPLSPTKVLIRPYPFNSPLALELVSALDADLSALHPDWDTLPHPGYNQGFVQPGSRPNPLGVVPTEYQIGKPPPVQDALDADDTAGPVVDDHASESPGSDRQEMLPANWTHLTREDVEELHFFIAFDVTGLDSTESPNTAPPDYAGSAIGCVGLKPLPYFPYHRKQTPRPNSTAPKATNARHAELKRMYVVPTHRRRQITTPDGAESRLATALVQVAVEHARALGADRLVLETGTRQVAAMRLYERLGWRRREMYGDYVGAGVEDGGVGVCYEFVLG